MKSSASIAISLTLIMFILVLAAAVFFLFQEQQTLKTELSNSEDNVQTLEKQQAEMELNEQAVQATLEIEQAILATASFDNVELEGQLSESANANATLEALNTEQATELENASATVSSFNGQGPVVNIVEPQANQSAAVDQPVSIVIVASDPQGVNSILYNVNGELFTETVEESPIVTLRRTWTPTTAGTFIITASAVNSNEIPSQSSQFNSVTVNVIVPEPTETPTPTETPRAEETPSS